MSSPLFSGKTSRGLMAHASVSVGRLEIYITGLSYLQLIFFDIVLDMAKRGQYVGAYFEID